MSFFLGGGPLIGIAIYYTFVTHAHDLEGHILAVIMIGAFIAQIALIVNLFRK